MSYIRSHSNPERLYIFDCDGYTTIYPKNNKEFTIPTKIFRTLLRRWYWMMGQDVIRHKGAKLEEILTKRNFCKYKLSYNGQSTVMFRTTLHYIAHNVVDPDYEIYRLRERIKILKKIKRIKDK